jgi:hypothetical protein
MQACTFASWATLWFVSARPINISTFYSNKVFSSFIETKYLPKTDIYFGISRSEIKPLFDYTFFAKENYYTHFNIATAQFAIQWNPFSGYMQTSSGRLEIEKRFPKFSLQVTQSCANVMGCDFDFTKIDFNLMKTKIIQQNYPLPRSNP